MKLLKKLDARGVAHHFALVVIVLAVCIGGTYELVKNFADSVTLGATQVSDIAANCKLAKTASGDTVDPAPAASIANCESAAHSVFVAAATAGEAGSYVSYINNTAEQKADLKACQAVFGVTVYNTVDKRQFGVEAAANVCQNGLGGDEDTAAAKPHDYEGHIVATNQCNNIEVQADDQGSLPTPADNMSVTVELTGGPYPASLANAARLGPTAPNDSDISGTSATNTYHHWTSPIAIQNYDGSAPITATLVVKVNGNEVAYKGSPSQVSIAHCLPIPKPTKVSPPTKGGKPVSVPAPVSTAGKHQYEGHIVVATCNNLEVEAHDFGSSPSKNMTVSVKLSGGAYGTKSQTLTGSPYNANLTDTKTPVASEVKDYAAWTTPITIKDYTDATLTTTGLTNMTLTILDNGKVVSATGAHTTTINPCASSKLEVSKAMSTCDTTFPILASDSEAQQKAIAKERLSCMTVAEQEGIEGAVNTAQMDIADNIKLPSTTISADKASCEAKYSDSTLTGAVLSEQIENCETQLETQQKDKLAEAQLADAVKVDTVDATTRAGRAKQAQNNIVSLQANIKSLQQDIKHLQTVEKQAKASANSEQSQLNKAPTSATANKNGYTACLKDNADTAVGPQTTCQIEYAKIPNKLKTCLADVVAPTAAADRANGSPLPSVAAQTASCNNEYRDYKDYGKLVNTSADATRSRLSSEVQGSNNASSSAATKIANDKAQIKTDRKEIETQRGIKEHNENIVKSLGDRITGLTEKLQLL